MIYNIQQQVTCDYTETSTQPTEEHRSLDEVYDEVAAHLADKAKACELAGDENAMIYDIDMPYYESTEHYD